MTDHTVVSLCRQYLAATCGNHDNRLLLVLCDRLEEIGFTGMNVVLFGHYDLPKLRDYFARRTDYLDVTVPAILKQYNGGEP